MNKFEVQFFEEDSGKIPAEEFLNSLDKKMRAKIIGIIALTNGFIKKTTKTPKIEIVKAKKCRQIYIARCKKNEKI